MRRRGAGSALALAGAVVAGALVAGACKKQQEPAPGPPPGAIGAAELRRGHDACRAYAEQVCACAKTVPAAQEPCALAGALPESLDVAAQLAAHPETERRDAVQAAAAARKTIARCIEHTAKLPALGCAAPGLRP